MRLFTEESDRINHLQILIPNLRTPFFDKVGMSSFAELKTTASIADILDFKTTFPINSIDACLVS